MQTDPIADFLTRLRNAAAAKHQRVDVPVSRLKTEIARILKEEGYISTYKLVEESKTRKMLRVFLKYTPDRRSVITGMKRISRPGARAYRGATEIRPVVGGLGISILTTPKGLMSGRAARHHLSAERWRADRHARDGRSPRAARSCSRAGRQRRAWCDLGLQERAGHRGRGLSR